MCHDLTVGLDQGFSIERSFTVYQFVHTNTQRPPIAFFTILPLPIFHCLKWYNTDVKRGTEILYISHFPTTKLWLIHGPIKGKLALKQQNMKLQSIFNVLVREKLVLWILFLQRPGVIFWALMQTWFSDKIFNVDSEKVKTTRLKMSY